MHIAHIPLEKWNVVAKPVGRLSLLLLCCCMAFHLASLYGWLCHTVKIITFSMSMSLKKRRRHELEWILLDFFWYGFSLWNPSDLYIRFFTIRTIACWDETFWSPFQAHFNGWVDGIRLLRKFNLVAIKESKWLVPSHIGGSGSLRNHLFCCVSDKRRKNRGHKSSLSHWRRLFFLSFLNCYARVLAYLWCNVITLLFGRS